jgi:hypothetical protein
MPSRGAIEDQEFTEILVKIHDRQWDGEVEPV